MDTNYCAEKPGDEKFRGSGFGVSLEGKQEVRLVDTSTFFGGKNHDDSGTGAD